MSFRSRQPMPPSRHRSSSATRSGGGSSSASSYTRPRSVGLFTSPFNTNYSSSYGNNYSSPYSSYSSTYKSPYFTNGYKGSTTYASLTIPTPKAALSNILPSNYDNSSNHRSRSISRQGSFNRERSVSKSRSPSIVSSNNSVCNGGGGMGSRSISLTSLNSEGYVVRRNFFVVSNWNFGCYKKLF